MGLHTVDDDDGPHTHYDASKAHVGIRDHVEELFLKKKGPGNSERNGGVGVQRLEKTDTHQNFRV